MAIDIISNIGIDLAELKTSIEEVVQPSGGTMTMASSPDRTAPEDSGSGPVRKRAPSVEGDRTPSTSSWRF